MNIAAKAIIGSFDLIATAIRKGAKVKTAKSALKFGKAIENGLEDVVQFRVSPDITMPVRLSTIKAKHLPFNIDSIALAQNPLAESEIGNMAVRINEQAVAEEPVFRKLLEDMFPDRIIETRAKGISSNYSKLKNRVKKRGLVLKSDNDGFNAVTDYVAGRVHPKDFTRKDLIKVLQDIEIDNRRLTRNEKRFILRALNGDKSLSPTQRKVANRLMRPVLLKVAEKQSEPEFNKIILGIMKDALNRKITTIDKLAKERINPKLLEQLQSDSNIKPIKVVRFCNYRGPDGIPVFSDNQIREIERMQLATGEKFSITTCASDKDLIKYGMTDLSKSEASAIKDYGYTRAQMNIEMPNGRIVELQVGKGDFYRLEHDAIYNCMQTKNTINDIFKPYQAELLSLDEKSALRYQRYSQNCHNDDRISQLGGRFSVRNIPKGLPKSLSRKSMEILCDADDAIQKAKKADFVPHFELSYVA